MSDFDDWFEKNGELYREPTSDERYLFESGQQSQQAKIDELKKKYDAMYNAFVVADDCRKEWHESYISVRKERDELQGRIDEVLKILDGMRHNGSYKAIDILKGNKDETGFN